MNPAAEPRFWRRLAWPHLGAAAAVLLLIWGVAIAYRPTPFTDFHAHWASALNLGIYLKGGILILVYAPLARLGVPASTAATLLNSLAWMLMVSALWIGRRPEEAGSRRTAQVLASGALAPLGFWWIGMGALVNTDLPHLGLTAFALRGLLEGWRRESRWTLWLSGGLLGLGVSIRLQSLPPLLGLLVIFFGVWLWRGSKQGWAQIGTRRFGRLAAALLLAAALAGSMDLALRSLSELGDKLTVVSRSPLYNGILVTRPGQWCGCWRPETTPIIEAEVHQSLREVVVKHLGEKSWGDLAALVTCKMTNFLGARVLAADWLATPMESDPNQKAQSPGPVLEILRTGEKLLNLGFRLLLLMLLVPWARWSRGPESLYLPAAWLLLGGYIALHLVMEIQPRYLMPVLVFPFLLSIHGLRAPLLKPPGQQDGQLDQGLLRRPRA